jgi:hypothetical protein
MSNNKINVNNFEAELYQDGEVQISICKDVLERNGYLVYLNIRELKKLLQLAEGGG